MLLLKRYRYFLHHTVREDKTTTKVRVVFNASEKSKNGVSLNDTLMIGTTLQAVIKHIVFQMESTSNWNSCRYHQNAYQVGVAKEGPEKEIGN